MDKIPHEALQLMFQKPEEFARMLRYGIEHCERSLQEGHPEDRFRIMDGHGVWFAETQTADQWLDLLWESTENSRLRYDLVNILRRAVLALPDWRERERHARSDALRLTAPAFLGFARTHRISELLSAFAEKFFGRVGWVKDPDLCARVLLTLYACNRTIEAWELFRRIVQQETALEHLTLRQMQVFCAEYITSARLHMEDIARGDDYRDFLSQLDTLAVEAFRGRSDAQADGDEDFSKRVKAVMDEALHGIALPKTVKTFVDEVVNAVRPELVDPDDLEKSLATVRQVHEQAKKGSTLPAKRPNAPSTASGDR
jgi:hypothetical protein